MTHNEFATYHNDIVKANKLFIQQLHGKKLSVDLAVIFRTINTRKFNADMYGEPYVSAFKKERLI